LTPLNLKGVYTGLTADLEIVHAPGLWVSDSDPSEALFAEATKNE